MMKLKELRCPNCGANLSFTNVVNGKIKCDYCESSFEYEEPDKTAKKAEDFVITEKTKVPTSRTIKFRDAGSSDTITESSDKIKQSAEGVSASVDESAAKTETDEKSEDDLAKDKLKAMCIAVVVIILCICANTCISAAIKRESNSWIVDEILDDDDWFDVIEMDSDKAEEEYSELKARLYDVKDGADAEIKAVLSRTDLDDEEKEEEIEQIIGACISEMANIEYEGEDFFEGTNEEERSEYLSEIMDELIDEIYSSYYQE